jgi:ABC-type bacteriocin/lantibiotic exporter with double-glycine peptidase domain
LLALVDLPFVLLLWVVLGIIAWPLLVLMLAWTAVYVAIGLWQKERVRHMGQHASQLQTRKFALLADALSSLDALRTSHVGPRFQSRFAQVAQDHGDYQTLLRHAGVSQMLLSQTMYTASYVSLLVLGAYLVFAQQMTQGALIAAAMLSGRTLATVGMALMTLGRWRELQEALKALNPFLQEAPATDAVQADLPARAVEGDIKVLQLAHGYGGTSWALKDITLHIRAGERVALMGRPGSGKSTLARVLAHAIAPTEGEVRVDDVALAAHGLHSRAQWLSFKPQEATLVAGTVESNILAALPADAPAQERTEALQRALYLSGMDLELSSGTLSLSQLVEEYGANLSGGQRQKVALARALAVPAKVLILDEPTNGLDPESEKRLVERLARLQGVTLILVSHSARALALCPRVIALDRGRVVADGATRDLVKVDPIVGADPQQSR